MYYCEHCHRSFPDSYPFRRKDGGLNPLAQASAYNNFKAHEAVCGRKKPVRIKANETFSVKIAIPEVCCSCGEKWESLNFIRSFDTVRMYCPKCGKEGPEAENRQFAMLAWGGMISREKKGGSGVRDV